MMIELLFVMAIILVLFVLYWGGGFGPSGKIKKQRNFVDCSRNLQLIHTALLTYSADNKEKFPYIKGAETSDAPLSILVPKYTSQTAPFICPASEDKALSEGEPFAKKRISYAYAMGLRRDSDLTLMLMADEMLNVQPKGAGDPMFSSTNTPPANNHGPFGGNLLLVDGSVQHVERKAPFPIAYTNATLLNPKPNR